MPRDSQGNYSLPPVYLAVTGQTVLAEQHNTPLTDIAASITGSLPRNGTGSMLANLPMGAFRITNLANGTSSTDAATVGQAQATGVPIGAILDFAGTQAPTGYFLCYGQAVSRADYAALFTAIGTTYGTGDGATTFNVPDCRAVVVAGRADMGGTLRTLLNLFSSTTLGTWFGAQTHTLSASQTPVLTGTTGTDGAHQHNVGVGLGALIQAQSGVNGYYATVGPISTSEGGDHFHNVTVNTGGGGAHNNVQPTIVMNKIIKAFAP